MNDEEDTNDQPEAVEPNTELAYSQADVFKMLEQLEEASATQFNMLANAYQNALDNYGTNMQMQFELAGFPFGGTLSPVTQQFLDDAKASRAKVKEACDAGHTPSA